ncbi:hypothetical protein niasHT_032499 [Heterodera trifolii]
MMIMVMIRFAGGVTGRSRERRRHTNGHKNAEWNGYAVVPAAAERRRRRLSQLSRLFLWRRATHCHGINQTNKLTAAGVMPTVVTSRIQKPEKF